MRTAGRGVTKEFHRIGSVEVRLYEVRSIAAGI